LVVGPGVSSIWVRLGPPETIATLLLVISLAAAAAAARRGAVWDVLFVVSGLLAMLAKEPFALSAIGLAGFRLVQPGRRERRAQALLASGLVVLAGLAV